MVRLGLILGQRLEFSGNMHFPDVQKITRMFGLSSKIFFYWISPKKIPAYVFQLDFRYVSIPCFSGSFPASVIDTFVYTKTD